MIGMAQHLAASCPLHCWHTPHSDPGTITHNSIPSDIRPMPGTITEPVSLNSRAGCKNHSLIGLLNWIILTLPADWSADQANSDISFLKHFLFCLIQWGDEMPQEVNFTTTRRIASDRSAARKWEVSWVSWMAEIIARKLNSVISTTYLKVYILFTLL